MTCAAALLSEPIAGGWMSYGGPGSWMNQAVGIGLKGAVPDRDVERLIAFYASRGIEPKVELCPFAHPTVIQSLSSHGFRIREFENVMSRDQKKTEDLRALHPHKWPPGFRIVQVDIGDAEQVESFIDVSTSGFRPAGSTVSPALHRATRSYVLQDRCMSFLGLINDEPVAGAGLDIGEGIGCLIGTSVLPQWQRKGIQSALIVHRLEALRQRGINLACIHSLPGIPTERNATRLGFTMAYTKAIMVRPAKDLIPSP